MIFKKNISRSLEPKTNQYKSYSSRIAQIELISKENSKIVKMISFTNPIQICQMSNRMNKPFDHNNETNDFMQLDKIVYWQKPIATLCPEPCEMLT